MPHVWVSAGLLTGLGSNHLPRHQELTAIINADADDEDDDDDDDDEDAAALSLSLSIRIRIKWTS